MLGGKINVLELLIGVAFIATVVVGWWKIFSRAGYAGFVSLVMYIPIVNFVAFLWFAFLPWPIEDQLVEASKEQ